MDKLQYTESLNTSYAIDGFRSLRNFKITLRPGINVLVGPNGSGKTNFIEFLDFLDNVIRQGASAAVSSAGGVARVFSIEDNKRSSPTVTARVEALAEIVFPRPEPSEPPSRKVFNFEYEIEIKFSRSSSAIYISREVLRLRKLRSSEETNVAASLVGGITLIRRSASEEEKPRTFVGPRLFTDNERNPLNSRTPYLNRSAKETLSRLDFVLMPDESFLSPRSSIQAVDSVRYALSRGRSFNIIPARAREPDDLTRIPAIQRDGAGLSATLHNMQTAQSRPQSGRRSSSVRRRVPRDSLAMVIEWTKLVFPELQQIQVAQDPHTGKYLVHLIVGSEDPIRLPLQAASDGTVKWLAFVALIISSGTTYSVEEPENFLHPKMQQFLIQLIRDAPYRSGEDYFILSTHSETLINQCIPEELILFSFDGATSCHRLSDPEQVQKEINRTGFGLGYYYASNSLS